MSTHEINLKMLRACESLFKESSVDYLQFWELISAVDALGTSVDKAEKTLLVLTLSRCLVEKGLRVFSFQQGTTVQIFWDDSSQDILIERIREEWELMGEEPVGLGDVCWFSNLNTVQGQDKK